jgi:hypothetical protein
MLSLSSPNYQSFLRLRLITLFTSLQCSTTMGTPQRSPEARSTLRQFLKKVLKCQAWSAAAKTTVSGPGILERTSLASPYLPELSLVSLFPDFEAGRFGTDRCTVSTTEPKPSLPVHLHSTYSESRLSLLPGTRLSQFDLHGANANYAAIPRRQIRCETLPKTLGEGASQRASVSTLKTQAPLRPRSSTLRIRRSTSSAPSRRQSTLATGALLPSISSPKKSIGSEDLLEDPSGGSFASRSADKIKSDGLITSAFKYTSVHNSRSNASIHSVKHFKSFCVLDTCVSGCPVTATSKDLRYNFQIGDRFTLKIQECEGTSIDIVTGSSPDGEDVIHLVLFSPLLSPSTGMSRFSLATLIEVTHFVHEASLLAEVDAVGEGSASEDGITTPVGMTPQSSWPTRSCELLAADLLGGCSIEANTHHSLSARTHSTSLTKRVCQNMGEREPGDIWLALAREERLEKDLRGLTDNSTDHSQAYDTQRSSGAESTGASSPFGAAVDEVLDDFMSSLQNLYSESFLLARSPLDDKYYEICNVSPVVYASGEYVTGHLTHTASHIIEDMSERLGAGDAFRTTVRWGSQGVEMQLYCVPLYGRSSITWICFLVNLLMPNLW